MDLYKIIRNPEKIFPKFHDKNWNTPAFKEDIEDEAIECIDISMKKSQG